MTSRQAGLEQVAAAAGAELQIVTAVSERLEDTQIAMGRHIDRMGLPDAFIGGNDQMAIAALTWALDRNLSVPRDIRIAGFNGFDFSNYVRPTLTTVKSQAYEMGKQGAAALLVRLNGGKFAQSELVFPVELRAGASD